MTVISVAFATKKFLFGMCDCMIDSDVGTGDFPLVMGILLECGNVHRYDRKCLRAWTGFCVEL